MTAATEFLFPFEIAISVHLDDEKFGGIGDETGLADLQETSVLACEDEVPVRFFARAPVGCHPSHLGGGSTLGLAA